MKKLLNKVLRSWKGPESDDSSDFSRFFRYASSREKKKVFMDVARRASNDQKKILQGTQ